MIVLIHNAPYITDHQTVINLKNDKRFLYEVDGLENGGKDSQ